MQLIFTKKMKSFYIDAGIDPMDPTADPGTWNTIETRKYIWDGFNIAAEIIIDNVTPATNISYYTWGLDLSGTLQGAGGVGGLLSDTKVSSTGTNTYYSLADANGNITEYVDGNGTVEAHIEYSATGEETYKSGAMKDDFMHRFSTKTFDKEIGIVQYEYRPYDPVLSRFLSVDPMKESGGKNLYGFVGNDPVNRWDYLGFLFNETYQFGMFLMGLLESHHLGKLYADPYPHCSAVNEGYYRHCLNSCVLNRLQHNPAFTMMVAMYFGGDVPLCNWDSGSYGDIISNLKGIVYSYNIYSSCERSCKSSFDRKVKKKCCSSNVLWNKSDKRCCDEK